MKRTLIASILGTVFGLGILASGGVAVAQKNAKGGAGYEKVKTYDFSGDEIEGDLIKPDIEDINTRKGAVHSSLIKIRLDFIREIVKSAEDL